MGAIPSFLKVKDDSVYYSGENEFLLFVPELYFDHRNLAVIEGVYIELMGVLNYAYNIKDGNVTPSKIRTFYYPSRFITKPGRIEKVKNYSITKNYTADYTILHYTNNNEDQIIVSTKNPQTIDNVDDFFGVFVDSGKIPNTVHYKDFYKYFLDGMSINGASYHLPPSLFGAFISEICRDPDDINKPFRLSKKLDEDDCSYYPMSVKDLPKIVSPFTSLTSENFDKAVVGAIMNKNNQSTPLERVLTG